MRARGERIILEVLLGSLRSLPVIATLRRPLAKPALCVVTTVMPVRRCISQRLAPCAPPRDRRQGRLTVGKGSGDNRSASLGWAFPPGLPQTLSLVGRAGAPWRALPARLLFNRLSQQTVWRTAPPPSIRLGRLPCPVRAFAPGQHFIWR